MAHSISNQRIIGFIGAFTYTCSYDFPKISKTRHLIFNLIKISSYIPLFNSIFWGFMLYATRKDDMNRPYEKAFRARVIISLTPLGSLLFPLDFSSTFFIKPAFHCHNALKKRKIAKLIPQSAQN